MKAAFYLCWAIWWIGGVVSHYAGWNVAHAVCVNLFGPLTVLLALVWAGRWAWRRARGGGSQSRRSGDPDEGRDPN